MPPDNEQGQGASQVRRAKRRCAGEGESDRVTEGWCPGLMETSGYQGAGLQEMGHWA
jgi:hypothetical protein